MKKVIVLILCVIFALTACAAPGSTDSSSTAPVSSHENNTSGLTSTKNGSSGAESSAASSQNTGETSSADSGSNQASVFPKCDDYMSKMEAWETLEVAYIGMTSPDRSVDDIIDRAANELGFPFADELRSRIVYGACSAFDNCVYLFIPTPDLNLYIGQYSWYAGEVTHEWFSEQHAKPFIFVETSNDQNPLSQIVFAPEGVAMHDGDFMYTGLNFVTGELRTDYHMGFVDMTDYDALEYDERPFYAQYFFDTLLSFDEISDKVYNKNYTINNMDEMFYDGDMFNVYSLSDPSGNVDSLLAVHLNMVDSSLKVMQSDPSGQSWTQLARG